MTILQYLDLSTAHLRETTLNPAPHPHYLMAQYPEGAFFYVPDTPVDASPDLAFVLDYAKAMGCTIVRFDADGEVIPGLPVFDW